MCIIVSKNRKKKLKEDIWKECFRTNGDGAGFTYIKDGAIVVEKGFFTFEEFWKAFEPLEEEAILIHFRISTHGGIDKNNCHPFQFDGKANPNYKWVMAHNGVLAWRSTNKKSDTSCFCEDALWPLLDKYPDFLEDKDGLGIVMLEKLIGDRNKMVIVRLDVKGNNYSTYIINKTAGNYHNGCWFSNQGWRPYRNDFMNHFHHHQLPLGHRSHTAWEWNMNPGPNGCHGWYKNKNGAWIHPESGYAMVGPNKKYIGKNDLGSVVPVGPDPFPDAKPIVVTQPDSTAIIISGVEKPDIQVPRDDDVDNETFAKIDHLNKEERKKIRRMAYDFIKSSGGIDVKGITDLDKINHLRQEVRGIYPAMKTMAVPSLDKLIISMDINDLESDYDAQVALIEEQKAVTNLHGDN